MNMSGKVVVLAILVAVMGLPDSSFGYSRGRRIRVGNKQQPSKSATKTTNKAVTVTGTVGSTPGSNGTVSAYSLRGDDHKEYVLAGHETELNGFIAKRVQITGKLTVKSGSNVISVDSVKAAVAL